MQAGLPTTTTRQLFFITTGIAAVTTCPLFLFSFHA
jgi:hypothetical protein